MVEKYKVICKHKLMNCRRAYVFFLRQKKTMFNVGKYKGIAGIVLSGGKNLGHEIT